MNHTIYLEIPDWALALAPAALMVWGGLMVVAGYHLAKWVFPKS